MCIQLLRIVNFKNINFVLILSIIILLRYQSFNYSTYILINLIFYAVKQNESKIIHFIINTTYYFEITKTFLVKGNRSISG